MNNILTTFSTPIYNSKISNYDIIQNELEESYNKINFSINPQWGHTHYLSDPTFKENLIIKYQLENFSNEIHKHLKYYCESIQLPIREYFITSSWFSLFKKGNYAHIHNHGECDIAGVYYFKKSDNDGCLFLCNPAILAETSIFRTGRLMTRRSQGDILLFPGWIDHGVQTNETDSDRISVSFNIKFRKEGRINNFRNYNR